MDKESKLEFEYDKRQLELKKELLGFIFQQMEDRSLDYVKHGDIVVKRNSKDIHIHDTELASHKDKVVGKAHSNL